MVEKVDAEVVSGSGGKSPTAAKTEELIDSAKDVYSQLTVSQGREGGGEGGMNQRAFE